jgi:archaellum component FlaF (FlaF/FlaG flagellin family)
MSKKLNKKRGFAAVYGIFAVFTIAAVFFTLILSGCFEVYPKTADMGQKPPSEEQFNEEHPGEEPPPPDPHPEEFNNEEPPPGEPPPPEPEQPQQQSQTTQQQTQTTQQQTQTTQQQNWTTDVLLVNIYTGNQPHGQFHVTIANNGPGTLNKVSVRINTGGACTDRNKAQKSWIQIQNSVVTVKLSMKPGEAQTFPTGVSYDLSTFEYDILSSVECDFDDPDVKNNMKNQYFN